MLNDKFEKILELEADIKGQKTDLPRRKEAIVGEYRNKAQQEIASISRELERRHEEHIQKALDEADVEREKIMAHKEAIIDQVSKQYEKNREQVIEDIIMEVMTHGHR